MYSSSTQIVNLMLAKFVPNNMYFGSTNKQEELSRKIAKIKPIKPQK